MIDREVLQVRRDHLGRVAAVVHRGCEWSPRSVDGVVEDLDAGHVRYVVCWEDGAQPICRVGESDSGVAGWIDVNGPDGTPGGLELLPAG